MKSRKDTQDPRYLSSSERIMYITILLSILVWIYVISHTGVVVLFSKYAGSSTEITGKYTGLICGSLAFAAVHIILSLINHYSSGIDQKKYKRLQKVIEILGYVLLFAGLVMSVFSEGVS